MHKPSLTVLVEVSLAGSCILLMSHHSFGTSLLGVPACKYFPSHILEPAIYPGNPDSFCLVGFRNQDLCSRWLIISGVSPLPGPLSWLRQEVSVCVCVCVRARAALSCVRKVPWRGGHGNRSSILAWRIPVDRGAWQAAVHRVAESNMHTCTYRHTFNRHIFNTCLSFRIFHVIEYICTHMCTLIHPFNKPVISNW